MIMKVLRIQAKKRSGFDFCDFRLARNSSEKRTEIQKEQSSNEKLIFDGKTSFSLDVRTSEKHWDKKDPKSNEKPQISRKSNWDSKITLFKPFLSLKINQIRCIDRPSEPDVT